MEDLETLRKNNIQRNKENLDRLGINLWESHVKVPTSTAGRPALKRRKIDSLPPSRASARIASTVTRPVYDDNEKEPIIKSAKKAKASTQRSAGTIPTQPVTPSEVLLEDADKIRTSWSIWTPSGSAPIRDDQSTFHFDDFPSFLPNKSPEEMLREGCFGGSYFRPLYSRKLGITISDDYRELPLPWTQGLDIAQYLTSNTYDSEINKYKVKCGQSIEEWEAAGWIDHRNDVRGWFQWYCRFFMGRRCDDDERQISRWRKCVGETGRWRRMLLKKYKSMGVTEVFDDGEDEEKADVSPVMHQTCHQWAYEVRQHDLDDYWRSSH